MSNFEESRFASLAVPLPEDIQLLKDRGEFEEAIRLCEKRIAGEIPEALREKLQLEVEILKRLPANFPYTFERALARCREVLPDLTEKEFYELRDAGRIDWIYLHGEPRYFDRCAETLVDAYERNRRSLILLGKIGEGDPVPMSEGSKKVHKAMERVIQNGRESWKFRIRASLKIKDSAFVPGRVSVWLPFPRPCGQISGVRLIDASSRSGIIAPETVPQRTICFTENLTRNQEFFVEYEFLSTSVYNDLWTPGAKIQKREGDPAPTKDDLAEELPHIRFTPYLRALAGEITRGKKTDLEKARAVYDFITTKVTYSYQRAYFLHEAIAEYTAVNLKGDCGMQAILFITLCRILGIPARWQSSLQVRTDEAGCHDWAQFYLPEYGWLTADPSYGGGAYDAGDETKRRFYFGNMDPFRMVANSAFQRDFDPSFGFLRCDPYDNQVGEAAYADRSLAPEEFDTVRKVTLCQLMGS